MFRFCFQSPADVDSNRRRQKYKRSLFYGLKSGNSHHVLCSSRAVFKLSFLWVRFGNFGCASVVRTKTHLLALPLLTLPIARPTHLFQRVHGIHTYGEKIVMWGGGLLFPLNGEEGKIERRKILDWTSLTSWAAKDRSNYVT